MKYFLGSKRLLPFLFIVQLFTVAGQAQDSSEAVKRGKKYPLFNKLVVPVSLIGLGIYGSTNNSVINHEEIKEERNELFPNFHHKADNYFQFAPIGALYAMDALGKKGEHGWKEQTILLTRAQLIMMAMIVPVKKYAHVLRPDSSGYNSFPSGHTAQAFMGAMIFYKEYGRQYPWLTAGMFTLAGGIGAFRVLNNRHWISDVMGGAGFGILSAELSYMLQKKRHCRNAMPDAIVPAYKNGAVACTALFKL